MSNRLIALCIGYAVATLFAGLLGAGFGEIMADQLMSAVQ